ncbi:MAG: N-6 DNA methylase [Caldilineaceae bacterium]
MPTLSKRAFTARRSTTPPITLARMNMFLHNINYDKFNLALGNTLLDPHFGAEKPLMRLSRTPYSVTRIGSDDPTLINDERFAPAGVLAPKSKAGFAFVSNTR